MIKGMVESIREKEGKEQKMNGKKNAILFKNIPTIIIDTYSTCIIIM